ncbi:MAG: hypothetical protein K6E13_06430 [Lachnospiraceae bacterium]|nr:hypothetical protein [Lachnospiraceae bacterium]
MEDTSTDISSDSFKITFKERVATCAIENAKIFQNNFVQYEYCICSKAFTSGYSFTKALDGNYLHLVGVNTSLPADSFFKKCLNGTLTENDFDFSKPGVGRNALKGSVRHKIKVLPDMVDIFSNKGIYAQQGFSKNQIACAFASSDGNCTLGFANSGHPKSLLRGDHLENNKRYPVDIVLRRKTGEEIFDEVLWKIDDSISDYKDTLKQIVSKDVHESLYGKEIEPSESDET